MQDIMSAVYVTLVADTAAGGVSTLVGGRIHEIQAGEDPTLPYVVTTLTSDAPRITLTTDKVDSEIAIDIIGNTNDGIATLRTIGERVFTVLNRQSLAISNAGFTGVCNLNCLGRGLPTLEADEYRIMQSYRAQLI